MAKKTENQTESNQQSNDELLQQELDKAKAVIESLQSKVSDQEGVITTLEAKLSEEPQEEGGSEDKPKTQVTRDDVIMALIGSGEIDLNHASSEAQRVALTVDPICFAFGIEK